MQARALVKERARRNLLLLIDGLKSEEMLLANLAGIGAEDFRALEALELIAPATSAPRGRDEGGSASAAKPSAAPGASAAPAAPAAPLDYGQFTAALTQLISSHL